MLYTTLAPAGVMELVDVVDSKSTAGDSVPVRVRSPAPYKDEAMIQFHSFVLICGCLLDSLCDIVTCIK